MGVFAFIVLLVPIALLIRNERVYRYRLALLEAMRTEGHHLIEDGRDTDDLWEWFDSVSYNEHFLKFWKPVRSFYPDAKTMLPGWNGGRK